MCYPKPGPRCSAHAAMRLTQALNEERTHSAVLNQSFDDYLATRKKVEAARADFYATPAGQKALDRMLQERPDDEQLQLAKAKGAQDRAAALFSLKTLDVGDVQHPEDLSWINSDSLFPNKFQEADEARVSFDEGGDEMVKLMAMSHSWINKLSDDEMEAVGWFTADGAMTVNGVLGNISDTSSDFYLKKHGQEKVDRTVKLLDDALAKYETSEPVVVYRGVSGWFYDKHDISPWADDSAGKVEAIIREEFVEGEEYTFNTFVSTSYEPKAALRFARTNVMMEMKTTRAAPVVNVSERDTREREGLLPRNSAFKVHKILENVDYDGVKTLVIQLEQI